MTDAPHHRGATRDPIAKRLREARDSPMERSQLEWAKLLGVTKALVSHWETGRARPSYETIDRISMLSSLSCDYIVAGRPSPSLARYLALPPALREWFMHQLAVAEAAYRAAPFAYEKPVTGNKYDALIRYMHDVEANTPHDGVEDRTKEALRFATRTLPADVVKRAVRGKK